MRIFGLVVCLMCSAAQEQVVVVPGGYVNPGQTKIFLFRISEWGVEHDTSS